MADENLVPEGAVAHTPVKRGRKPGSKAKVRQDIPPDQFKLEEVPAEKRGLVRRIRVERTPQQKALDTKVLELHKLWVDSGRPTDWLKMPVREWPVEARYADDALFMLKKAVNLHGFKLHLGNVETKEENGKKITRIPLVVRDRRSNEGDEETGDENDEDSEATDAA